MGLLVLWSALTGVEPLPAGTASGPVDATTVAMLEAEPPLPGSLADHHLDDQPGRAQADPAPDVSLLLPSAPRTAAPGDAAPWRVLNDRGMPPSPFLDGPLRPPRARAAPSDTGLPRAIVPA